MTNDFNMIAERRQFIRAILADKAPAPIQGGGWGSRRRVVKNSQCPSVKFLYALNLALPTLAEPDRASVTLARDILQAQPVPVLPLGSTLAASCPLLTKKYAKRAQTNINTWRVVVTTAKRLVECARWKRPNLSDLITAFLAAIDAHREAFQGAR